MDDLIAAFLESRTWHGTAFIAADEDQPSIESTRFGCELAARAKATLPIERRRVVDWLGALDAGTGYQRTPVAGPELSATYYAVRLYRVLDAPEQIERRREQLMTYLASEVALPQNQDVDQLYYLVRALHLADLLDSAPFKADLVRFFRSCRAATGGFGNRPGDPGDIEHTYCSTHALMCLGEDVAARVDHEWIGRCARADGWIQWSPEDATVSCGTLYWGAHLGLLVGHRFDWMSVRRAVRERRRADGGWGETAPSLWQTYCAISAELIAEIAMGEKPRSALGIE